MFSVSESGSPASIEGPVPSTTEPFGTSATESHLSFKHISSSLTCSGKSPTGTRRGSRGGEEENGREGRDLEDVELPIVSARARIAERERCGGKELRRRRCYELIYAIYKAVQTERQFSGTG